MKTRSDEIPNPETPKQDVDFGDRVRPGLLRGRASNRPQGFEPPFLTSLYFDRFFVWYARVEACFPQMGCAPGASCLASNCGEGHRPRCPRRQNRGSRRNGAALFPERGVFAPPSPFFTNVKCAIESRSYWDNNPRRGTSSVIMLVL